MSLSAEEFANGTLKLILSKFLVLPLKPFRIPRNTYLFTHDLTRSPLLSTWVTHVKRMRRVRGTFVQFLRANRFFTMAINTPSPLAHFLYFARPLSSSSLSNPSAAATSLSPVRKIFTASTSSPPYSRPPRKSSLRRRRSRLPPPS